MHLYSALLCILIAIYFLSASQRLNQLTYSFCCSNRRAIEMMGLFFMLCVYFKQIYTLNFISCFEYVYLVKIDLKP